MNRRGFLGLLAGAAALLGLSKVAPPTPPLKVITVPPPGPSDAAVAGIQAKFLARYAGTMTFNTNPVYFWRV